jgi:hypothetical protein
MSFNQRVLKEKNNIDSSVGAENTAAAICEYIKNRN